MKYGRFRPCIDIHDGVVKQIVGGSLTDTGAEENFASTDTAAYYAKLYREKHLPGGHIINLNKRGTPEYEKSKLAAISALKAYPRHMQIGGGISPLTAFEYLDGGADAVIVTSYVFKDGKIDFDNLKKLNKLVGKHNLVLDLSVRKINAENKTEYRITTDRWQKITDTELSFSTMYNLRGYCKEFLIHAADVEGKRAGIDMDLAIKLGEFTAETGFPVTYAGGVRDYDDALYLIHQGLDFTVGSALDIFGGDLSFEELTKTFGKAL
jgi:phosphoribosylformimino-5-aminoimidazole carboxamide ribotide isomerase